MCRSVSRNILEKNIWCAVFDSRSKLLQPIPETIVLRANIFYLLEPGLVRKKKALENQKEIGDCVCLELEKRQSQADGPYR